ncbi:MAG: hypothetical protein Q9174_005967, partial [Haloplaca sp. 1 TL-2023]
MAFLALMKEAFTPYNLSRISKALGTQLPVLHPVQNPKAPPALQATCQRLHNVKYYAAAQDLGHLLGLIEHIKLHSSYQELLDARDFNPEKDDASPRARLFHQIEQIYHQENEIGRVVDYASKCLHVMTYLSTNITKRGGSKAKYESAKKVTAYHVNIGAKLSRLVEECSGMGIVLVLPPGTTKV